MKQVQSPRFARVCSVGSALVLAASLLASLLSTQTARAQDTDDELDDLIRPDDPVEAATWFEKGKVFAANDRLEDARHAFRMSRRYHATPQCSANLAAVELAMKRYREAAEHSAEAITTFDSKEDPARVTAVQQALDAARAQVGTVRVVTDAGADIFLDASPRAHWIGSAPLAGSIFVDPGHVVLRAEKDGRVGKGEADIAKGETREITILLPPLRPLAATIAGKSPRPDAAPKDVNPPGGSRLREGVLIGSGLVMLSGIGVAIGGTVASNARDIDASSRHDWTVVAVSGAGVAIAADLVLLGAFLFMNDTPPAPAAARVRVLPAVSPAQSGLVVRGAF